MPGREPVALAVAAVAAAIGMRPSGRGQVVAEPMPDGSGRQNQGAARRSGGWTSSPRRA
jgi:hypothetical protein